MRRMTENDKKIILQMRKRGLSYGSIAKQLNLNENTIKTFFRRGSFKQIGLSCLLCGNDLLPTLKGRKRKFCSEECRRQWWKTHEELKNRKTFYTIICAYCGKTFESYGNKKKRYCNHACYINARYYDEGGS